MLPNQGALHGFGLLGWGSVRQDWVGLGPTAEEDSGARLTCCWQVIGWDPADFFGLTSLLHMPLSLH